MLTFARVENWVLGNTYVDICTRAIVPPNPNPMLTFARYGRRKNYHSQRKQILDDISYTLLHSQVPRLTKRRLGNLQFKLCVTVCFIQYTRISIQSKNAHHRRAKISLPQGNSSHNCTFRNNFILTNDLIRYTSMSYNICSF